MSSLDAVITPGADGAQNEQDLGPLAWVLDELRKSLDSAVKAMRRFVRDAEIARESDLAALDAGPLRIARQQLHQASGALEMVGMAPPALLLRAMESAVQRFVQRPELCSDEAAATIERASFALIEYLECVLAGKAVSPVALFPQYRDSQALAGADRVHPADLWPVERRPREIELAAGVAEPLAYGPEARARLDSAVLRIVKNADPAAAADMRTVCQGFAAAQSKPEVRAFWGICAGFFEALAQGALKPDVYAKRVASRVLMQYATLAKGDDGIGERLVQDLLFFCAQAAADAARMPALQAVREAFGLQGHRPVDYDQPRFGRFDPAVLAQARKRIAAATETWSALAGGDRNKLKPAADQFSLVCDSLRKLHPDSDSLAQSLTRAMDATLRSGEPPSAALAMEVATAVLYLQASLEELDGAGDAMAQRATRLAERLDGVVAGGESQPLEPWMEELYRRVSDHQTMGSVVGELRATLSEAEKSMDQYFRQPENPEVLRSVPGSLQQMRGVLSVLGLDQASLAVVRMRDMVERLLIDAVAEGERQQVFEKLGNSMGALGFLVDMLSYQRAMARKLFVYDEELGELRILMGRVRAPEAAGAEGQAEPPLADLASPEAEAGVQAVELPPEPAVPEPPAAPALELPTPAAASAPVASDADDGQELLDIFLEEAREVVAAGQAAIDALHAEPGDLSEQTTLRRAFHTLKGSSRMVGLSEFGEAAWSMEQVLNAWLAEQKPMQAPLLQLSADALQAFARWADDIAAGTADHWQVQAFRAAADAMRQDGTLVPLAAPTAAQPLAEEEAGVAPDAPIDAAMPGELPQEQPPAAAGPQAIAQAPEDAAISGFDLLLPDAEDAPQQDFADTCIDAYDPGRDAQAPAPAPDLAEEVDFALFEQAMQVGADVQESPAQEPAGVAAEEALADDQPQAPPAHAFDIEQAEAAPIAEPDEPAAEPAFEPSPAWADAAGSVEPDVPSPADEAVKVIEHLRIGIPLYNVYLNEADEWSRRLCTSLQEWSLELHQPLPDTAVALAHSLAGSSATVGFTALSGMARTLEHALQHVQLLPHGLPEHAQVFNAAADDIRRLLHQFAAGFLKEPNALVLERLQALLLIEVSSSGRVPLEESAGEEADAGTAAEQGALGSILERELQVDEAIARAVAASVDIDDDIDALDIIDPDLFPIFEEEALELLPALGTALRQWSARPENLGARNELLRALHTLKGSARLAGAMRLGELAHRMETAVEQIGADGVTAADIEPLLSSFDALQAGFDALRTIGAQPLPGPVTVEPPPAAPAASTAAAPAAAAPGQGRAPVAAPLAWAAPAGSSPMPPRVAGGQSVRVRAQLLDRLVNQAGEVVIARSRLDARMSQMRASLGDLTDNLERLRQQLRDIEVQAESQMQSRLALSKDSAAGFDPLEFDRFTRVQELTRMMAESVNDVATVQRNMQRALEGAEDDLVAQGRQARELQRDLLHTRMVEFEGISERLYAVVRQVSKETGKQIKLDISGGSIEMDRGVLDRMTPAFEHLLRNCAGHGIEAPEVRTAAGKPAVGTITIALRHEGNDVSVEFRDDGAGLDIARIRAKAVAQGLAPADAQLSDAEAANLIFLPGLSTATEVTGLSGRGIGMDVVRSEVHALGGRIETWTEAGKGSAFRMVLPLTTAVTQVVMLRAGGLTLGVPASLVEIVRRGSAAELEAAYATHAFSDGQENLPFYWAGALLQSSACSTEAAGKYRPVLILRSAAQRIAVHVDEVLGNQEVVVKNLGPQLSRLPGLTGMSVLASGAVVLIYNPVALATVYGDQARAAMRAPAAVQPEAGVPAQAPAAQDHQVPLVLVVDDSITVRRVTQRLLQREGYRVALAADGLQALERLQQERPAVVLSDIEMPRMDGFDLARNIRGDAALRDLPIIMITSRIAQKHRDHAAQLGVNHYLGKPYSDEELMSLVRHYARLAAPMENA
ncbi:response regulator [Alicycliphilus denitrificans]|uniref:Chemotaxis protein CheA n=1 Tax=Alicycliphilus denitrificans TaxID=179636 RepID=A0A858ZYD5_9BURK|nr:Hpt domain-containing protein [Alicycliphilus denitrificans]ADV01345.1 response regulator receiver [Alicycliphilus denitrificans BC]QKD45411.1 response regulator [Alicycliphilus denitrificans]GAO24897.1 response regulator receiver [Alicycliphilus sp. B1]